MVLSKKAISDLKRLPVYIVIKLQSWVDLIVHEGLLAARRIPGYHDELLRGERMGHRSIRLNRAYRAIYRISELGDVEVVDVLEVNKHKY